MAKEKETWTADHASLEQHLTHLRDVVLTGSLGLIHDGRNSATKVGFSKDVLDIRDWARDPLRADGPFGFDTCCKAAGVDPEELREKVEAEFAKAEREIGTSEKVRRYLDRREASRQRKQTVDDQSLIQQKARRQAGGLLELF